MMRFTCDQIRERWPEYIYRELSEPEQSLFVRHLGTCPACQNEEREWRNLLVRFDSIAAMDGSMEAPPELIYRVKRQVHLYEDWSKQYGSRLRRWTVGVAAACLLVCGGLTGLLFHGRVYSSDEQILTPIQNSVLHSLYDTNTLRLYREQGFFLPQINQEPNHLVDNRNISKPEPKKDAPSNAPS